jgi:predicted MFS family arabinose efflux permease
VTAERGVTGCRPTQQGTVTPASLPVSQGPGDTAIALGLALGPVVAVGLARFAYSLLLPAMRAALGWSFATAGAMNTANAAGYLAGALLAGPLVRRLGARRLFLAGLVITASALAATAASASIVMLIVLRLVAGVSGAAVFIAGAGMAARLGSTASHRRAALLLGIYFAGGGLGIVVSGLAIPPLLAAAGDPAGWRWGWALLGGLAVLALAGAIPAALAAGETASDPANRRWWPARHLAPLLAAYGLFGAGYIGYITFIVAFLRGHGARPGEISGFWVVLGAAAIGGSLAWAPALGRLSAGRGGAATLSVVTAGASVPLISAAPPAAYISALLFGSSFLAVVTAITTSARRFLQPRHWTAAITALTVAFAAGQCLGPVLAGVLADTASGVRAGIALSAGVLAAAVPVSLAQPRREPALTDETLQQRPYST